MEEDEVLKEIPIYLSKKLSNNLHVFQYLNKPSTSNYFEKSIIEKCAIKPSEPQIKMEILADTSSETYDLHKGENIAMLANDSSFGNKKRANGQINFSNNVMDRYVYKSISAINCDSSRFACGYLIDNELHLTPIKSIIQLNPSLDYLDIIDKQLKNKKQNKNQTDGDIDDIDEESDDASKSQETKIIVKFASSRDIHSTNNSNQGVKKSLTYSQNIKKMEEEPWIEKKWYNINSLQSEREKLNLFSSIDSNRSNEDRIDTLILTNKEYCNILLPNNITLGNKINLSKNNKDDNKSLFVNDVDEISLFSINEIESLTLLEKCRIIMKRVNLIYFNDIVKLLKYDSQNENNGDSYRLTPQTKDELLKAMQQVAVLVRGIWIVKSEILYPKGTFSSEYGINSERMCSLRDYITKEQIAQSDIMENLTIGLSQIEINEMLSKIASHEPNKGWKIKLTTNVDR